jgi:xanthine dehydrogenase accessory factor
MLVLKDGATVDTIGGGPLERQVAADASECLVSGVSRTETYGLTTEGKRALGSLCGGEVTVFLDVHAPAHTLLIVGAGHVGHALARCAELLDYRLVVLDSREDMVTREHFPTAQRLVCGEPALTAELVAIDETTHVVIVTHSHKVDKEALRAALGSAAASIGMMGSARKIRTIFSELRDEGVAPALLEQVHSPIGLDIGAETPAELALSIMAEIVAVRHRRPGGRMELPAEDQELGEKGER